MDPCVFCEIIAGRAPATVVRAWPDTIAIHPRHPVTPGHVLVIPRAHVPDAATDHLITGTTTARASEIGAALTAPHNLITSIGSEATQTVFHLHVHVVPRHTGDGLPLPWTPQHATRSTHPGEPC